MVAILGSIVPINYSKLTIFILILVSDTGFSMIVGVLFISWVTLTSGLIVGARNVITVGLDL